jgi:hypothetical protein
MPSLSGESFRLAHLGHFLRISTETADVGRVGIKNNWVLSDVGSGDGVAGRAHSKSTRQHQQPTDAAMIPAEQGDGQTFLLRPAGCQMQCSTSVGWQQRTNKDPRRAYLAGSLI